MESDTPRQGGASSILEDHETYISYEYNTNNLQNYTSTRLNEAGISIDRGVPLKTGTKRPANGYTGWQNRELRPIDEISGHWGIRTGDGLVVFDIDDWNETPDEICRFIEENPTLTIESPHTKKKATGKECHYFYSTGSNLNKNPDGCEIQGDGALVATGSEIHGIRGGSDCSYEDCCSEESPGRYTIKEDRSIAHVPADEIDSLVPDTPSTADGNQRAKEDIEELPEVDPADVEEGIDCLQAFKEEATKAFTCLMDRLNGGKGHYGDKLLTDGERIDRSRLDFVTLEDLYGIMLSAGKDEERGRELTYATYSHYCEENPFTKDGQKRKWVACNDKYRRGRLHFAIKQFDPTAFGRFCKKVNSQAESSGQTQSFNRKHNRYSNVTRRIAQFCCELLAGEYPDVEFARMIADDYGFVLSEERWERCENHHQRSHDNTPPLGSSELVLGERYPTKSEVIDLATDIDRNGRDTFDKALIRLRKRGILKMACITEGMRYVYYPSSMPDPQIAEYVRTEGEKIDTDESESPGSDPGSPLSIGFEGATSPPGAIHLDPRGIDHLWPEQSEKLTKRPYL